jgi:hypothetical protein
MRVRFLALLLLAAGAAAGAGTSPGCRPGGMALTSFYFGGLRFVAAVSSIGGFGADEAAPSEPPTASGAKTAGNDAPDPRWRRVAIEPMKTSIYLGSVRLTPGVFERSGDTFTASYDARVVPFFFFNESGRVTITLPEPELRRVANGEVRPFTGEAVSTTGEKRRVEGRAEPAGADHGKIKVRIFVSKRIELIFNGTYRFAGGEK